MATLWLFDESIFSTHKRYDAVETTVSLNGEFVRRQCRENTEPFEEPIPGWNPSAKDSESIQSLSVLHSGLKHEW